MLGLVGPAPFNTHPGPLTRTPAPTLTPRTLSPQLTTPAATPSRRGSAQGSAHYLHARRLGPSHVATVCTSSVHSKPRSVLMLEPPLPAHIRLQVRHRSSDRFARNMRSITKSGTHLALELQPPNPTLARKPAPESSPKPSQASTRPSGRSSPSSACVRLASWCSTCSSTATRT